MTCASLDTSDSVTATVCATSYSTVLMMSGQLNSHVIGRSIRLRHRHTIRHREQGRDTQENEIDRRSIQSAARCRVHRPALHQLKGTGLP